MDHRTCWGFAVVPDDREHPVAVFTELQEAMNWGLEHVGDDAFVIRRHPVTFSTPIAA